MSEKRDSDSFKYIQYEKGKSKRKRSGTKTLAVSILITGILTIGTISVVIAGFKTFRPSPGKESGTPGKGTDISTTDPETDGSEPTVPETDPTPGQPETPPGGNASGAGIDDEQEGTKDNSDTAADDTAESDEPDNPPDSGSDDTSDTGSEPPAKETGSAQKDPDTAEEKDPQKSDSKKDETGTASSSKDNSCFKDDLFVGDSRTEGLFINTGLTEATFYATKGLAVDNIYTKSFVKSGGSKNSKTVLDALKNASFDKIYLMFGVNELGWAFDYLFIDKYTELIQDIQERQPNAEIIVQSIIPVTKKKSDGDKIYNNKNVNHFNDLIEQMCEDLDIQYIDLTYAITGDSGVLPEDGSSDGVHLTKSYYNKWLDYLREDATASNKQE